MSKMAALVRFTRTEESPRVSPSFVGIAIRVACSARDGIPEALTLHGVYQLRLDQADLLGVTPLQRAVVITATAGLRYRSFNMVGDALTFEDDERVADGLVQGYFTASLLPHFSFDLGETCYILASMGPLLSNIVAVSVTDGPR